MKISGIRTFLLFMGSIALVLLLYIIFFSSDNLTNKPPIKEPTGKVNVKPDTVETVDASDTIKFNGQDSVRLEDETTLSRVNRYLKRYSELNITGDVKEYLKLYKNPVLIGAKSYDEKELADFAGKYFARYKTQFHYFEYTRVYARKPKEFIVYTRENHDYTELATGKYVGIMAEKKFVLQRVGTNLYCTEMQMFSFVKK